MFFPRPQWRVWHFPHGVPPHLETTAPDTETPNEPDGSTEDSGNNSLTSLLVMGNLWIHVKQEDVARKRQAISSFQSNM